MGRKVQKGFTFWVSYYDVAQELSPKQQGEFYRAIIEYMFTDDDPEETLSKSAKLAFKAIKANLKTSIKRSEARIKTESNDNQTYIKTESNEHQYKEKDKGKDKGKGGDDIHLIIKQSEPADPVPMPETCRAELVNLGLMREVR